VDGHIGSVTVKGMATELNLYGDGNVKSLIFGSS
jgi:hypothetical protein